jgi:hypothetical protein
MVTSWYVSRYSSCTHFLLLHFVVSGVIAEKLETRWVTFIMYVCIFNKNRTIISWVIIREHAHGQREKVKQSRYTPWRRLGGEDYSCYTFTTSALDADECSESRLGRALPPGEGPAVPIVQEAGWAPDPVWTQRLEEKSSWPCQVSNLDRPDVQPLARHYTDWATRLAIDRQRQT